MPFLQRKHINGQQANGKMLNLISEMQIKSTGDTTSHPPIKKTDNSNYLRGHVERNPHAAGNVKGADTLENSLEVSQGIMQ